MGSTVRRAQRTRARDEEKKAEAKEKAGQRWRLFKIHVTPFFLIDGETGFKGEQSIDPRQPIVVMEADIPEAIYELLQKRGNVPQGVKRHGT